MEPLLSGLSRFIRSIHQLGPVQGNCSFQAQSLCRLDHLVFRTCGSSTASFLSLPWRLLSAYGRVKMDNYIAGIQIVISMATVQHRLEFRNQETS